MKRILLSTFACGIMLFMAACGSTVTSNDPNAINTSASAFSKKDVTIFQGQTLTFVDNDAVHYLIIGTNATPEKEPGAPDFGGPSGHTISEGQVWVTPTWDTPGVYHVTCTIHPNMNLKVTVVAATPTPELSITPTP